MVYFHITHVQVMCVSAHNPLLLHLPGEDFAQEGQAQSDRQHQAPYDRQVHIHAALHPSVPVLCYTSGGNSFLLL